MVSPECSPRPGAPRAESEDLVVRVQVSARHLSTAQLDGILHGVNQSDTWYGNDVVSLPPEVDERWDLSSIWTGLQRLFEERTGHDWTPWSLRSAIPPDHRHWPSDSYMASWYEQQRARNAAWLAQHAPAHPASSQEQAHPSRQGSGTGICGTHEPIVRVPLLGCFANLCSARVREEVVDLSHADIRRRARRLLLEGRSSRAVRWFVWWQAVLCVAAVLCDLYHRVRTGTRR